MLSMSPMSGAGHENYYLSLVCSDYYLSGSEPPGVWWGKGKEFLKLPEKVEAEPLKNLLRGYSADGFKTQVQNAGRADRKFGDDLTFSAPKSVSTLFALVPHEVQRQIAAEHRAAVVHALEIAEREAAFTRRGHGGVRLEPVGLTVALFEHHTSRALDPQLHTHALVLNLAVLSDGQTRSLHSKPLYEHKMALGAAYRQELAQRLVQNLGLKLARGENTFELAEVPKSLCDTFSSRRKQILAALEEKGIYSAEAAKVAALATREPKELPPRAELERRWELTAREHGFGRADAERIFSQVLRSPVERPEHEIPHSTGRGPITETSPTAAPSKPLERPAATKHPVAREVLQTAPGKLARADQIERASSPDFGSRKLPRASAIRNDNYGRVLFRIPFTSLEVRVARHHPFYRSPLSVLKEFTIPRVVVRPKGAPAWSRKGSSEAPNAAVIARVGPIELQAQERQLFPNAPAWSPVAGLTTKVLALEMRARKPEPPELKRPPHTLTR